MYTMNVITRSTETRVVGVTFENRQAVVALLTEGERVSLIRDPDNPFDPNAVKVVRWDQKQIGFLDRELAKIMAPRMDRYGGTFKATVSRITGGYYPGSSLGVVVKFYLPE
jgi:single-stranded-DNA-specific exonuclease